MRRYKSLLLIAIMYTQVGFFNIQFIKKSTNGTSGVTGTQDWIRTIGGTEIDTVNSVVSDSSGNVYITGYYRTDSSNSSSVLDISGTSLSGDGSSTNYQVFVAKIDSSGTQQWIQTLGGTGGDYGNDVAVDSAGNVFVTGSFWNNSSDTASTKDFGGNAILGAGSSGYHNAFVAKLNSSGTQQWIKILRGNDHCRGHGVASDSSGNVFVTGEYDNTTSNNHNTKDFAGATLLGNTSSIDADVFVAKLNSSGTQQWISTMGGREPDVGHDIAVDGSGNVYVAGYYENSTTNFHLAVDFTGTTLLGHSSAHDYDVFVVKFNSSGIQQWIDTMGGGERQRAYAIAVDSAGNVYTAGSYENSSSDAQSVVDFAGNTLLGKSATSGYDAFVSKHNSSGTQQWIKALGGDGHDYNYGGIGVDSSGAVYVPTYYNNDSANSNSVVDFNGVSLNGKTSTASTDIAVAKLDSSGTQEWVKTFGGTGFDYSWDLHFGPDGKLYTSGRYTNDTGNSNSVLDFSDSTLNGKSGTSSDDGFVVKMN